MGRSKAIPLCPYVLHLYHTHKVLLLGKKKAYRIVEAFLKHNVESKGEDLEASRALEDSKCECLSFGKVQEIQAQEYACLKKSLHGKRGSLAAKGST